MVVELSVPIEVVVLVDTNTAAAAAVPLALKASGVMRLTCCVYALLSCGDSDLAASLVASCRMAEGAAAAAAATATMADELPVEALFADFANNASS